MDGPLWPVERCMRGMPGELPCMVVMWWWQATQYGEDLEPKEPKDNLWADDDNDGGGVEAGGGEE